MSSCLGKNKKPTTEKALQRVKELCEQHSKLKKKRKPVRFEINTDPKRGLHAFKRTYNSSRGLRRKGLIA